MKAKSKTLAQLKKDLTKVFNAYIRKRDSDGEFFTCISCGLYKPLSQMNAGHFYASTYSATRFDEDNVNGQCIACNNFKHGNLLEYRKGLLAKIGEKRVQRLEIRKHNETRYDRGTLEILIKKYKFGG